LVSTPRSISTRTVATNIARPAYSAAARGLTMMTTAALLSARPVAMATTQRPEQHSMHEPHPRLSPMGLAGLLAAMLGRAIVSARTVRSNLARLAHSGSYHDPDRSMLDDPEHWRQRAEEARTIADEVQNPSAKATMLSIAEQYEQMAEYAQRRQAEKTHVTRK
jgi:hypothetical protein